MVAITTSKTVLGVYISSDAVVQAIEEFQNQGYSLKDLSILPIQQMSLPPSKRKQALLFRR
jgi:hypothetical protein